MNAEVSRAELLQWVNETLKLQLQRVEQLGTGAVYCQLIDAVHPGKIAMQKVNWKAKQEYEYVSNFKILQQAFTKLGLTKPIEIEKLTKCKYQDNLEFLQWFRKYLDNHLISKDYDPLYRRSNQEFDENEKPPRNASKPKQPVRGQLNLSKNSSYATIQVLQTHDNKENKTPSVTDLLLTIEQLRGERDFYYYKFKELDSLVEQHQTMTNEQLFKSIKEILYFTQDKSVAVLPNGDLEVSCSEEQSAKDDSKIEEKQDDFIQQLTQ